jgi:glycine/D-amino acid oxidase-like deaminating enzyme
LTIEATVRVERAVVDMRSRYRHRVTSPRVISRSLVVVGAGVFGASLARQCALDGWAVTLVERVAPGHVRAGSGDESRLIRCGHGPDEWHTRSARRAWALWHEIDPRLVVGAGVLWLAHGEDGWEAQSERTLRALGIPCERVDPAGWFPSFAAEGVTWALHEPEAGILRAREATRVLAEQAVAAGAELVLAQARPDGAAVALDDGRRLEADRVVWACGAWLPALFPGLVTLRITQQDVFYFAAPAPWRTPGVPAWIDYDAPAYGLGDLDGRGVKVCSDVEGPAFDVERADRVPLPEHERRARQLLAGRFPALADAPLAGTRTCQYELTPDTRFLVAPHPEHDGRVWLLGGGSGHGFKHGPALAEEVERRLSGDEPPDPRFGLGARVPDRALRTAGAAARA